ncbi:MAG: HEAT repeat domain-containing protein, partial [Pseudanabaenaceae cyanobacterium]
IKQLLRQGRLLLLVDGVNELPSDPGRVMVNQFRELYQKTCPMIFTTRELSAGVDLGIAQRLEMQPLTEPQMQQFVMAYLPTQGERLLRQLSGRLREFGQTPLLLWMLCEVFKSGENNLNNLNLGKIFQVFTKAYVTSSIRNHQVSSLKGDIQPLSDRRLWSNAMKYLASLMMDGDSPVDFRVVIPKDEIIQKFTVLFKDETEPAKVARDCLDDLLNYHLIQNRNADNVEFLHQLIQEYYAAEYLWDLLKNDRLSDTKLQHSYLNYLDWTESLALMLELVESEEQAVRVVRLALEVDLRLGARLAGAVKAQFQKKTVGILIETIKQLKISEPKALEIFRNIGAYYAVQALSQSETYLDTGLDVIGTESPAKSNIEKSSHTVKCLNEYEAEKEDLFTKSLRQSINYQKPHDRIVLVWGLWSFGEISEQELFDHLKRDFNACNYWLRLMIIKNLNQIVSEEAIDILIHTLNDPYVDLRFEAAKALGKIGSEKAIDPLICALKDSHYDVRINAAWALGKIGSEKAVDPLICALKDLDYDVRRNAAEALGKIGSEKAIDPLICALKDSHYDMRRNAAWVLGEIGSEKAVDPLIHSLKYEVEVRFIVEALLESLFKIDEKKQNFIFFLYLVAGWILSKIYYKKVYKLLILIFRLAAWILGKIGSKKVYQFLILFLRLAVLISNEADNRKYLDSLIFSDVFLYTTVPLNLNLINALGWIGGEKAVESLILTLNDSDNYVRKNAVDALGWIGSEKAIEPLILALNDSDSYVGRDAAEALGWIAKNAPNLPTLTQQLPHLLTLIPTEASQEALSVITTIQTRCKYYNYGIAQIPLQETENNADPVEYTLNELTKAIKKMSDAPKYDLRGAKIDKLIDNIGVYNENNFAPEQKQNLADAAKEIQDLLDQLAKTYPSATEAEAKDIVKATFEEIKTNHPDKWKILWTQILNPERWLNGGKAALSEATKHYAENSVILKVTIAFFDGFSADEE